MSTPSTVSSTPPHVQDYHAPCHHRQRCHHPNSAGQPVELRRVCSDGKGNIDKINAEFDTNYSQLLARGATLNNPIGIISKAYLLVPCYNFTKYIPTKHDKYLDGNLSSLTHKAMMSMTKCKFDFLKTKEKWGATSGRCQTQEPSQEETVHRRRGELSGS